jgi:hypothetical protein
VGRIVDVHRGPIQKGGQGLPEKRSLGSVGFVATLSGGTLSWDATSGATNYFIYMGTSTGSYDTTIETGNVTSYVLSGIPSGTYFAIIRAYDGSGFTDVGSEISFTVS